MVFNEKQISSVEHFPLENLPLDQKKNKSQRPKASLCVDTLTLIWSELYLEYGVGDFESRDGLLMQVIDSKSWNACQSWDT